MLRRAMAMRRASSPTRASMTSSTSAWVTSRSVR
jgi:hypothetical protein